MPHSTAWIVTPEITVSTARGGASLPTPTGALRSLAHFVSRISDRLRDAGETEGTVLVTDDAYALLGLAETAPEGGLTPALATLERTGWRAYPSPGWWTFRTGSRPQVHLGMIDRLDSLDPLDFPFNAQYWHETAQGIEDWKTATGVAWQQDSPVMGIELIHKTVRSWREPGVKGNRQVVKRDDHTPASAGEAPWTPSLWRQDPPKGLRYLHSYDRYRAGLTAAGAAKCAVEALGNGWRKFDPKRAGWWQIEVPAWNMKELPHPCGPVKRGKLAWVCTATLDLVQELADDGLMSFPDIVESWTAPARQTLLPFQQLMEKAYQDGPPMVRAAVKQCAVAGMGMLANPDSSFPRADWYNSVNATKRANIWRTAYKILNEENRVPVAFDDDTVWYASDIEDGVTAAPKKIAHPFPDRAQPWADIAGGFRYVRTVVREGE